MYVLALDATTPKSDKTVAIITIVMFSVLLLLALRKKR